MATIQLSMVYVFHTIIGMTEIISSVVAFIISVLVNFSFQKFWSFQDLSRDKIKKQFSFFALNAVVNLAINSGIVYFGVHILVLNIYVVQPLALAIIAIFNFFIYKIIFRYNKDVLKDINL